MKRWTVLALVSFAVTSIAAAQGLASQDDPYAAEVRRIARRPEIRRAFEVILELEPRTLRDHIALTQVPAPPFGEERRARRYAEMLREAGIDSVDMDEVGNVIARRKGKRRGKVVALAAHLDTVFPEGTDVTVRVEGHKLHAPGIGDDTRGLIVVLTVLRAMNAAAVQTDGDVLFIGTVGEEGLGDLRGVKHLFDESGPRIDSWIAVDGGGSDRVLHRGLGSSRYRVTFRGPGGHSWAAFGLANPAHALSRAIYYFEEEAAELVATGPRTSYSVGRIGGGTSVNAIPFENWMEVDMRSVSPERLSRMDAVFRAALDRALAEQNERRFRRHGEPLTMEVEKIGERPSGEVNPETPIVQRAVAATRFFGIEPKLTIASTDSNIPISLGVPAITIGRGGVGEGGHSLREWWSNDNGHIAIQKALLILVAEAGLAGE